ncbi:MAG: nitrite reductase [Cyclobacteriaceae bacterium]
MNHSSISPIAKKDIGELKQKIGRFHKGEIPEERFKAFRLTRGVYGQRQLGVQMLRIKLPYGKIDSQQLVRIADISEAHTNGNLHATTRQCIQLHYIKLDDTPAIWTKLEEVGVTTREACGNTVRNLTASPYAGIDPEEPFDVTPYGEAVFQYFLRNPICQDMGRKVKMAFSSSEQDAAYTYFHDFGFIPRLQTIDGQETRGFKVVVGGGLGAQAFVAPTAFEFLPEDQLIPFLEAGLRVFDRYGEREKRFKARLKFLIDEKRGIGLAKFLSLVEEERRSLQQDRIAINSKQLYPELPLPPTTANGKVTDQEKYEEWLQTNVFEQKQKGFYGVNIKLLLGNIKAPTARSLASLVRQYAANDMRLTVNQGILLKFVHKESLPMLFQELDALGLAETGFGTIADITACPGTDTCNLGVTNSTGIAIELERLIRKDYHHMINTSAIQIKISGCMNSCGQHMAANIGFHGSSIKHGQKVVPALQVVIGGGVGLDGNGFIAEKVIKLPTKRIPQALSLLLDDYGDRAAEEDYFNDYFLKKGKRYFYDLLKHLGDLSTLRPTDYIDWGHSEDFVPEIGVGECAGASFDLVGTVLGDAVEKLTEAREALETELYSEAVYNSYNVFVISAKALLLSEDVRCNTQIGILRDFESHFHNRPFAQDFEAIVLQLNSHKPTVDFANSYLLQAELFFEKVTAYREEQLNLLDEEKLVVSNHYKA